MSSNRKIAFFVGASLVLGVISTSAVAQGNNTNKAAAFNAFAYSPQVFTNPMDAKRI